MPDLVKVSDLINELNALAGEVADAHEMLDRLGIAPSNLNLIGRIGLLATNGVAMNCVICGKPLTFAITHDQVVHLLCHEEMEG